MTYVIFIMTYVMLIYVSPHLNNGDRLILPCEVAAKSVVPAIKATMAKELVENYSLKQDQVAELLGVSQSAVSKYTRKIRGQVVEIDKIEEVQPLINEMINLLVKGGHRRKEFLRLFCQACLTVRKKGLMCQLCQKTDPEIKVEECGFCLNHKL